MIFANRYYLRKLNLDGSNYTLIKQVRPAPAEATRWSRRPCPRAHFTRCPHFRV